MNPINAAQQKDGLIVVVYPGDNKILIAISLDSDQINEQDKNLAGFAIWRTSNGKTEILENRLSFEIGVSKSTTAKDREWTPSDQAPFQKFRWVDVPPSGFDTPLTYKVQALYFTGKDEKTRPGQDVEVTIEPAKILHTKFRPAFTRGYIASQAYVDLFENKPIRPAGDKIPDFDTAPYQKQYEWLGADARQELFAFIDDCQKDKTAFVDVFAYDLDEPDIVKAICALGKDRPGKVRAILDDADLHSKPDKKTGKLPPEIKAAKLIKAALGAKFVKQGHFARYQHNKVFIKRDADRKGVKVIFGSMNFSVRGVYVQANNVIVVEDPFTAGKFAEAFDVAFEGDVKAAAFSKSDVAQSYMAASTKDTAELPKFSLALSPHKDPDISLGPMMKSIRAAQSSVLFAVMEPKGQGPVLDTLRKIAAEPTIFSYGTVETDKGLAVQSPNGALGDLTGFAALKKNVPPPFNAEFDGGAGMHIHDKFVVVDFNGDAPVVFTGSSNLAAGGEKSNGDSLAMIEDAAIANMYAIEAVAMFDHFHFRKKMAETPDAKPLTLWFPNKPGMPTPWWKQYYDQTQIQMRDRCLFAGVVLPAGMEAKKTVDWSAVDGVAAKPAGPARKRSAQPKKAAKAKKAAAPRKRKAPAARKAKATAPARKAARRPAKKKRSPPRRGKT